MQIWLHCAAKFCWLDNRDAIGCDLGSACVVCSNERMLAVVVSVGRRRFFLVAGHALAESAADCDKQKWWDSLDRILRSAPAIATPLLVLDANATSLRFEMVLICVLVKLLVAMRFVYRSFCLRASLVVVARVTQQENV